MLKKYGIPINEDTLPLITFLNRGVEPLIQEKPTVFILEVNIDNTWTNNDIKFEDDLYDQSGHLKEEIRLFVG